MKTKKTASSRYLVSAAKPLHLQKRGAYGSDVPVGKKSAKKRLEMLVFRLGKLQQVLYAGQKRRVLIVLQGMDTSGKDGAVKHIFKAINPMGARAAAFKKPSPEEKRHDFLWRIRKQLPRPGEIVIFNRSHYEDVVAVRVHRLAPKSVWSKRFGAINRFERGLAAQGTVVLKFFLNVSRQEQKKRLLERLNDPEKQWKFNPRDLEERKLWPQYMEAYEEALRRTSVPRAPWHVVPANHRWYRNLVISEIVVKALEDLRLRYPRLPYDPKAIKID